MKALKNLRVGDLLIIDELNQLAEDYEQSYIEMGGDIIGVSTCVIQGGNDECYIFVLDQYSDEHGVMYKLIYKY